MPKPVAIWNSARDVWETPATEGFFCEHLDVFSETFPTSGMTVNGAAYALPTWEPATDGSGSSSLPPGARVFSTPDLMPEAPNTGSNSKMTMGLGNQVKEILLLTPVASEGQKATFQQGSAQRALTGQPFLTNQIRDIYDLNQPAQTSSKATTGECQGTRLLPTPSANLGENGGSQHPDKRRAGNHQASIQDVAEHLLLPTPVAQHSGNTPENHLRKKPGRKVVTDLAILTENGLLESGGQIGASTSQLSADGSTSLDVQLPGQLNLLDELEDTA